MFSPRIASKLSDNALLPDSIRKAFVKAFKNRKLEIHKITDYKLIPFENAENRALFYLGRELGRGAQAIVYLAQELLTMQLYKVKAFFHNAPNFEESYQRECYHLKLLNKFIAEIRTEDTYYVFSEYNPGISLEAILYDIDEEQPIHSPYRFHSKKNLPFIRKLELCLGMISSVIKLHENNVGHRDLKPSNVIVWEDKFQNVALVDYASAIHLDNVADKSSKESYGTKGYVPPEFMLPIGQREGFTLKSDCYQLGLLLAEIVSNNNYQKMLRSILKKAEEYGEFESDISHSIIFDIMSDVFCPAITSVTTTSSATKDSISENALHINFQSLEKYNGNPLSMLTAMQMEIMQMIRQICGLLCSVNIKDRPDLSQLKNLHYELLNLFHSYSTEEKNFYSPKENLDILNEKNTAPRRKSLQGIKSTHSINPRSILNMVANKISPKEGSSKVLPQKADSRPSSITHALVLDLTLSSSHLGTENDMSYSPPLLLRNISRTNTVGNSSEAEVNFYKEVENLAQEAHKLNLKESEKYLKKAMVCENITLRPKKT